MEVPIGGSVALLRIFCSGRAGHLIEHKAAADLFHRHALGLERHDTRGFDVIVVGIQSRQRTSTELLGAHRRNVHEEEPALNGRSFRTRSTRLGLTVRTEQIVCVGHKWRA
jgi:hypothetical protein